jgi:hypothetical protein
MAKHIATLLNADPEFCRIDIRVSETRPGFPRYFAQSVAGPIAGYGVLTVVVDWSAHRSFLARALRAIADDLDPECDIDPRDGAAVTEERDARV